MIRRHGSDRDPPASTDNLAHRYVLELLALARVTKEERTTSQLADVKDIPREKQSIAKDRGEQVGVLASAHRAEQDHIGASAQPVGQRDRGCLEDGNGCRGPVDAERIAFEVGGGDPHLRRYEAVRHCDNVNSITCVGRTREGPRVLELAAKVQSAEKAEDLPEGNAFLSQTSRKGRCGTRSPERHRARPVRCGRRDQEYRRSMRSRHGGAVRNFGARDTFPPVQTYLRLPLGAALLAAISCVQPPPGYEPAAPPVAVPPARTQPVRTPPVNTPEVDVASDSAARAHLIDIRLVEPTIMVDARYATASNFTGSPLPGYESNRALLRREAASALARVQRRARNEGVALKVFDGYRPVRATVAMVAWAERTGQQHLLRDGYIASRSRHNLGLAVDLTLIGGDGQELDMGTPFDTFSPAAHTINAAGEVAANRRLLVLLMQAEGFTNYDKEWWHFTYEVPNPQRFDLVIR